MDPGQREGAAGVMKDRLGAEDTDLGAQVNLGLKAELFVAHNHLRMELQRCEDKESRKMRRGLGEVRVGWGISKNKTLTTEEHNTHVKPHYYAAEHF